MTHTEFCVRAVEGRPACCLPAWKILPPCNVASGHLELLVTQKPLAKLDFKHQASRGSGLRAFFPPRLAWGPLAGGPCLRTRTFPTFPSSLWLQGGRGRPPLSLGIQTGPAWFWEAVPSPLFCPEGLLCPASVAGGRVFLGHLGRQRLTHPDKLQLLSSCCPG